MSVQYFPLDFGALQKGDVISVAQVEEITGKLHGTDAYRLAALALQQRIRKELKDRDRIVTVRSVKGAIEICRDAIAAEHNVRTFKGGLKRTRKAFQGLIHVDRTQLDETQLRTHDRNVSVCGRVIQSVRKAITLRPSAHVRTTPRMGQRTQPAETPQPAVEETPSP